MNDLVQVNQTSKISNFEKPGGTLGLIVAGLGIGAGLILLHKILPFLITLTTNVITLSMLVGVLLAMGFLITNKRFRKTFSMIYFIIMRKITGLVIEIDPIAIVEAKIKEMKEKMQEISKQMGNIRGLISQNEKSVIAKKAELEKQLGLLKQYEERNMLDHATLTERQIVRLQASVERQEGRLRDSKTWLEILKKLRERAELVVKDTENEVEDRKEEYESIKAQHKAFSSIMSIIKGSPDDLEDFTYAMDFMAHDITMRLGEMTNVIEETGGLLSQISVEDGVTSQKANEMLRKYEQQGIEGLFARSNAIDYKKPSFDINSLKDVMEEEQIPVEIKEGKGKLKQRNYF